MSMRGAAEPPLAALLAKLQPVDLVLVEGFKREPHPKLEVWRAETGKPPLHPDDPSIVAVASDGPIADPALPRLDIDDIEAIADFVADFARKAG